MIAWSAPLDIRRARKENTRKESWREVTRSDVYQKNNGGQRWWQIHGVTGKLSLIHIGLCRRIERWRTRWEAYRVKRNMVITIRITVAGNDGGWLQESRISRF